MRVLSDQGVIIKCKLLCSQFDNQRNHLLQIQFALKVQWRGGYFLTKKYLIDNIHM